MGDALSHMIDALSLEVAAIRKRGSGTKIELRGGERAGQVEASWLYRFVVVDDLNLRDDTPVRVSAGQEDVSGILVSFRDGVLLVALEKDLGPKVPMARLVANDSFLVERLKERLEKVRSGGVQFNQAAADRVLGLAPAHTADAEPHRTVTQDGCLNTEQTLALRRSLGSDTTFVWGPPGTGKTTTLARIVEAHYRAGCSVLLVSNTNIAVDTALERVAERLEGEPDFQQGLVIRHGPVVKEELRQRFGPQVILAEIVVRLGESLRREKEELERQLQLLETEERSLTTKLRDWELLAQAQAGHAASEKEQAVVKANVATRQLEAEQHRSEGSRLRADLERAHSMGTIRRFFLGVSPERLNREVIAADGACQAATDAAQELANDLTKLQSACDRLDSEITRLSLVTMEYLPELQIQASLGTLRTQLGRARERISVIDRELAELEQQVVARCRILATTVYRTYLGKSASRQFDVVVVDEASMLMPPLVYYAAGLATTSVTVAGDFRQLPPIVMSDKPLAAEWLKCDAFEKAGIPQRLKRRESTPQLVALTTQYRMRKRICAVINKLFYPDHPLLSDKCVSRNVVGFPLSSAPLLYVDTARFHPWTSLRVGTYSRYNLLHALLVRNLVLHLAEKDYLPRAGEPNDAVGAVAPYSSQARLIQALLDDRLGSRAAGIAATVHRFQGNEKKAMILDLTDSFGTRLGHFLQATCLEDDGARLLNVATSRAKHHVVLIANFEFLRQKAPSDGFVRHLLARFEEDGEAIDLEHVLPLGERDWVNGLDCAMPGTFDLPDGAAGAFTEGTFYPAFLTDLKQVNESIVILSPFATSTGTTRWVDALRTAIAHGACVRIMTRPPVEWGGGGTGEVTELVRKLRSLGVVVDLRARMHEKIAILDGRILWHGSLNILSHRDTHESMLRIESPVACQQIERFLNAPADKRDESSTLDAQKNPECPKCGRSTVWNNGRNGVWFKCERPDCNGKVDPRHRTHRKPWTAVAADRGKSGNQKSKQPSATAGRPCPIPGCNGRLMERNGKFGRFLGCSRYPRCKHTEDTK